MKKVFNACVYLLVWMAKKLGMSYEAINVWIFCIIWPAITVMLIAAVIVLVLVK